VARAKWLFIRRICCGEGCRERRGHWRADLQATDALSFWRLEGRDQGRCARVCFLGAAQVGWLGFLQALAGGGALPLR
jgi:hypothetical protein